MQTFVYAEITIMIIILLFNRSLFQAHAEQSRLDGRDRPGIAVHVTFQP